MSALALGRSAPHVVADAYVRGVERPQHTALTDHAGKWVVLFFYPRDFTFICPTEIEAFARLHARFTLEDAVVLGASTDSYYCHKAWYETDPRLAGVEYPVIADSAHELSAALGVLRPDGAAMRATFISDPAGIVRHILVNDLDVGRNPEETLRTLQALRTGARCPVSWRPGQPTLSDQQVTVDQAA